MAELIKEERFIYFIATEEHVLRVQELIGGSSVWPDSYRISVPGSGSRDARKFYGRTAREVLEKATEYLSSTYLPV